MRMSRLRTVLSIAAASTAVAAAGDAQAGNAWCLASTCNTSQTSATYTGSSTAVSITNSGSGGNGLGATTENSSSSGVAGFNTTSGNGVYGQAAGGHGVEGSDTTNGVGIYGTCSGATCWAGEFKGNVNVEFGWSYFYASSTCIGGNCSSDERLKKNIEPLTGALDKLLQLRGVNYEWKDPDDYTHPVGTQTGFVAQEVQKVLPKWVQDRPDGFKGIVLHPLQLAAMEVESIRALNSKIDAQDRRIEAQDKLIQELTSARRPAMSMNGGGLGLGFAGLAIAGAVIFTRRKREERS